MKERARPAISEILATHTPALFAQAVEQVARLLAAGEVVALPTETVYGLAANALDPQAVEKIFRIKGRPTHNPVIVHVGSLAMARGCTENWPALADRLAAAFWPGPLTLVLSRARHLPDLITAGGPTVGIRWPRHPFMQAVIQACGFPLAAPSANLANQISPTRPEHVQKGLGTRVRWIVDGGRCQVGLESTVLDLTASPAQLLRPGMIGAASLQALIGEVKVPGSSTGQGPLRSPGQLSRHYAPNAPLHLLSWANEAELRKQLEMLALEPGAVHVLAHTRIPALGDFGRVVVIPHDPEAFARALYAELHACDDAGAGAIVVEEPPEAEGWLAILDRLRRGAQRPSEPPSRIAPKRTK